MSAGGIIGIIVAVLAVCCCCTHRRVIKALVKVLWEFGGMTEGELGKKVRLDSGTLAPLLKRLEKQGLIERIRPENNERKLFLKLTRDGEALKQKALAVPCAMQNCIQMPKEELLLLRELLNKALHSMETE